MTLQPLRELAERYEYEGLTERAAYERGRSDGYVDGFDDVSLAPTRATSILDGLGDQIEWARLHYGRATRSYTLGYARGYREAARNVDKVGYVLWNAAGEALAVVDTLDEAVRASHDAAVYYADAIASGHPAARAYVRDRLPTSARAITAAQRETILADGTPILQREP